MRLIDADELTRELNNQAAFESKKSWTIGDIKTLIRRQPTVQDETQGVMQNGEYQWGAGKC